MAVLSTNLEEKTVSEETIFSTSFAKIRLDDILDPYGNPGKRLVVQHPGGVAVAAIKDEQVLLVRQYRYAVKEVVLEIPAGKLEFGEEPLGCGKRELIEETGFKAKNFESLGVMLPTPGYSSEHIYLYEASDLHFVGQHLDPGEYVEPIWMPIDEVVEKILSGEITDAKTQIAIMKYVLKHK